MLIRLTFILQNGNEAVLYSALSPDMTYALVEDHKHLKNAAEVAKAIRYETNRDVWSEAEFRNRKEK